MSNEKKMIPKLRFPEFANEGEWKERIFEKVFQRITTKNVENNQNVLTISAQQGLVSQLDYFNKKVSAKDVSGYYLLRKGDFAYNKSYSKGYPMGAIKPLKYYDKGVVSTLYICFRAKDCYNESFLEQYFNTGLFNNEISKIAQEGGRAHGLLNVGISDFFNTMLIVPLPQEQQKIADCLSFLDDLIVAHSDKLKVLKDHKKGLMQNLFPQEGQKVPNYRFPEFEKDGEWVEKTLDEICEVNPKVPELPDNFIYIDLESVENGVLLKKNILNKDEAPSRAQRLLQENDVIYQMVRPYQKNNYHFTSNDGHNYVASTGYAQLRAFESSMFLFQLILTNRFVTDVIKKSTGSNYPAINSSHLKKIEIKIPPTPEEQKKIASCLLAVDEFITTQVKKIEQLRQHKKGLLQGLFPKIEF